jgi:hypothetical protein
LIHDCDPLALSHNLPHDAARYERRIRALEALGHRGSATKFEGRAAEYLLAELRGSGIDATLETFRGARSLAARMLVHMLVAAVGAAFLWTYPILTITFGGLSLVLFFIEQRYCIPLLSWPVCRYRSQNVCGKIPPRQATKKRIILSAHYDTQPSGVVWTINRYLMPIGFRSPLLLKPPMTPVVGFMAGQIVLGALWISLHASLAITVLNAILLAAYAVLSVLFVQWGLGKPVPGAADNGSGVAAVLEIAAAWRESPAAEMWSS